MTDRRKAPSTTLRRRAGMTLVEVLLAVVILGVALGALVEAASRGLAVVRQARNYELARRFLGQLEAEQPLRLLDEILPGEQSGGFQRGPPGWSWSRAIEDLGVDNDQMAGLFRVTTRVRWSAGERTGQEEIVQLLYVPENRDGRRTLKPEGF